VAVLEVFRKLKTNRVRYIIKSHCLYALNKLTKSTQLKNIKHNENGTIVFDTFEASDQSIKKFLETKDIEFERLVSPSNNKIVTLALLIIVGSLLISLAIFTYSHVVISISISGATEQQQIEIRRILSDFGFTSTFYNFFAPSSKLSNEISKLNNIASVNIYKSGFSLNIDVQNKLELIEFENKPLLAKFDGVVQAITVSSGTAIVKVGDSVLKGDVLIAPYRNIGEIYETVRASGIVTGRLIAQKHLSFSNKQLTRVYTDRSYLQTFLTLKEPIVEISSSYESYEVIKYSAIVFPFYVTTFKFVEFTMILVDFDFDQVKEDIINSEIDALIAESNFETIKNAGIHHEITRQNNIIILSLFYYSDGHLS
jgi:hypothetical protein